MGNCNKESYSPVTDEKKIFESIIAGQQRRLGHIVRFYKSTSGIDSLDKIQTKYKKLTTNALGLCILVGNLEAFKLLIENDCKINSMEKIFENSRFNPMEYLCRKGDLDFIRVYLPYSIESLKHKFSISANSYSIALSKSFIFIHKVLPIHSACAYGNLNVVQYLYEHFKDDSSVPREYDINAVEENTGENCAMIACRRGHYDLVKYLYKTCDANFHLINDSKENAIIVTIAGMNKNFDYSFINILCYLVEEVKVDVKYKYEEALLLAKCKTVYNILTHQLKKSGIVVERKDIEDLSYENEHRKSEKPQPMPLRLFTSSFIREDGRDQSRSLPSSIHAYDELSNEIASSIIF
jgi:Ankyrin repeats (many copies)